MALRNSSPEAELQPFGFDLPDEAAEAVREFAAVRCPVAQSAVVFIPVTEPAVIQDQQLHTEVSRILRQAQQQRFIKIQIGRLPAVEQDRTLFIGPETAAEVPANEAMEAAG